MSKKMKKILYYIFTFIQIAMIIGIKVVHNLSNKKAGLNHHLRFYRTKYNNEIFTSSNVSIFKIAICIITIVLVLCLIYYILKKKKNYVLFDFTISILCCISLIWMLISIVPMSLLVYPYMVLITCLVLLIQIIKIILII